MYAVYRRNFSESICYLLMFVMVNKETILPILWSLSRLQVAPSIWRFPFRAASGFFGDFLVLCMKFKKVLWAFGSSSNGQSQAEIQWESESFLTQANAKTAPKCTQWRYNKGERRITSSTSIQWQVSQRANCVCINSSDIDHETVGIPMRLWSFPEKNKKIRIPNLLLKWVVR